MPSFKTTRQVRHTAAAMFDLVADVEKYPLFLPMCTGLQVRGRHTNAAGQDVLVAEMSVGYKAIRESFTSRVTLDRPALKILVEYIDGPFSRLENVWTFQDAAEASTPPISTVDFAIDYEFRSRMLGFVMGGLFDAAFRKFAGAFERRADIVYGPAAHRATATSG